MTSEVTARARALVEERTPEARGLGQALGELIEDPDTFVAALRDGLTRLADEAYATEVARVAPTTAPTIAVRSALQAAVASGLGPAMRETSAASALWLAERLAVQPEREMRLFSHVPLRRSLPRDPERSWQLMRRLARLASDWISVDSLADLYARGIAAEPFRWAELEQLVYSGNEWERRLVGATVATLPARVMRPDRARLAGGPALSLIGSLIGDASEYVQKSLAWALRSWRAVDPAGVDRLLRDEARRAAATNDGHRAWVVREALREARVKAPDALALELRRLLAGVRRSGGPSTSQAAEVAARFAGLDGLAERATGQQGQRY